MGHPVGTGAYQLKEWTRGQKIVLEANPAYRDEVYPTPAAGSEPGDAAIAKGLAGQRLPLAGRVEINIVEEAQATAAAVRFREARLPGSTCQRGRSRPR